LSINVHIYPSPILNESRINKICSTLMARSIFDKVIVIGTYKEGLNKSEFRDEGFEIWRIKGSNFTFGLKLVDRTLNALVWYLHVFLKLRKENISCINSHSLAVLPLCVFLKIYTKGRLVYDTHELETETLSCKGIKKICYKFVELFMIRFVDAVSVVNESIAQWYQRRYNLSQVFIVKNLPFLTNSVFREDGALRQITGLTDKTNQIFLYQGLLSEGRGLDILIDVFSTLPKNKNLVIMGYGELEGLIIEASDASSNIHFIPAVEPSQLLKYTRDADVGLSLIQNQCLSYYLCLPNKLFEYLGCGVPVLASDFPEMEKVLKQNNCGWLCPPTQIKVQALIKNLTSADIDRMKSELKGNYPKMKLSWQAQEEQIINIYRELGFLGN